MRKIKVHNKGAGRRKNYPALEKEYAELELDKALTNTARNEVVASIRTRWGA